MTQPPYIPFFQTLSESEFRFPAGREKQDQLAWLRSRVLLYDRHRKCQVRTPALAVPGEYNQGYQDRLLLIIAVHIQGFIPFLVSLLLS